MPPVPLASSERAVHGFAHYVELIAWVIMHNVEICSKCVKTAFACQQQVQSPICGVPWVSMRTVWSRKGGLVHSMCYLGQRLVGCFESLSGYDMRVLPR